MTVEDLLVKLKEFDKNLTVCIDQNPWYYYTISCILVCSDNNTIILGITTLNKKTLNVRQLAKYLLESPSNAIVTFRMNRQVYYVESARAGSIYLTLCAM